MYLESEGGQTKEQLALSNSLFDNIAYKDQISSGDFVIEDGILKARFVLLDGSVKNETIIVNNKNLKSNTTF